MDHDEWLEKKKAELSAINGLDPVEELLTQLGVMKHSHGVAIEQRNAAFAELEKIGWPRNEETKQNESGNA
jgi:hypothetical protein